MFTPKQYAGLKPIMLTSSGNYEEWNRSVLERALDFGEAGRMLENRAAAILREPKRFDRRNKNTGNIIVETDFDLELAARIADEPILPDEDREKEIEDQLESEHVVMYPSNLHFEEAYKAWIRKGDEVAREAPKLIL